MNIQRLVIAIVVIYFVLWGLAYLFYETLFVDQLSAFMAVFRPKAEMSAVMPWMLLGYLVQVSLFCVIFTKNYENKGVSEGVRYGLWVGALIASIDWVYGVSLPIPLAEAGLNTVLSLVMWIVAGILLALIYKPKAVTAASAV
ncbi:MAG: hypothetical protein ACOY99_08960 [Pseudomonadota bacterium]